MNPESPYAPPQASLWREGAPVKEELASTGQRFANSLIDGFVLMLLTVLLSVLVGIATLGPFQSFVLSLALQLGYYIVLEGVYGVTPGKLVTGVRVISEDGRRASWGQITGRSFARMIPFEVFSFLGGAGRPVGWHDSLSGTRVIRAR
jgi:uncharacterized RDD family membrane protein YckC